MELLQRPAGRRPLVRGLRRAADIPALPEDGGRADPRSLPPRVGHPSRDRLGLAAAGGRRRPGGAVPPHPRRTREAGGDARRGLSQGAEQDPGPRQASSPDRRSHRPRDVVQPRRRRQG